MIKFSVVCDPCLLSPTSPCLGCSNVFAQTSTHFCSKFDTLYPKVCRRVIGLIPIGLSCTCDIAIECKYHVTFLALQLCTTIKSEERGFREPETPTFNARDFYCSAEIRYQGPLASSDPGTLQQPMETTLYVGIVPRPGHTGTTTSEHENPGCCSSGKYIERTNIFAIWIQRNRKHCPPSMATRLRPMVSRMLPHTTGTPLLLLV